MPRKAIQTEFIVTAPKDPTSVSSSTSCSQQLSATSLTPECQLLDAIESLYDDELRPYGRLIRKRLGEHAARGNNAVEGNLSQLRVACEDSAKIKIEVEADGEWSAVLVSRSAAFVDFYSLDDPYPQNMWRSAEAFFQILEQDNGSLPGGRYATALALVKLELPFLMTYSLGQVCHIVELAMTNRKLLGYLDGAIVPYARSHSKVKDSAAEQRIGNGNAAQQLPLASWHMARTCLSEILESATRKGKTSIPLSTLKRLYRSRFHTELSETALGYTKLTELLQDARISDLCTVQLLEQGYVLTPGNLHKAEKGQQPERIQNCIDDVLLPFQEWRVPSKWTALSPSNITKGGCIGSIVQNTFIHAAELPPTQLLGCVRRSSSVPKNLGSRRCAWEATCHALAFMPQAISNVVSSKECDATSGNRFVDTHFTCSSDCLASIDVDMTPLKSTECCAGIASSPGSLCGDPIFSDDLSLCLTPCINANNTGLGEDVFSPYCPLQFPSPTPTASPSWTPVSQNVWAPPVFTETCAENVCPPDTWTGSMVQAPCEVLPHSEGIHGTPTPLLSKMSIFNNLGGICHVSGNFAFSVAEGNNNAVQLMHSGLPTLLPQQAGTEFPWEEPKKRVLSLDDLIG